jgi:hypothetical protein
MHPIQQQGLRIPERIFDIPTSMRCERVSALAPAVTQQIHSLRASGVMSSHNACTFLSDKIARFKSVGSV